MSCIQLPCPQCDVFPCAVLKWPFGIVKTKLIESSGIVFNVPVDEKELGNCKT